MAKKIKGITVQLGGDTSGLTKALSDADKSLAATQREINEVQKSLKLDPSNVTLMAQKQELLTKAISDTSAKLRALEENQGKAKRAFEANAEWERKYAPLKESIDKASASLKELKAKQDEAKKAFEAGTLSSEDYEKVKAETKEAEKALADLKEQKKQLDAQFADGHITAEEYRAYQREVENTRSQLQGLQTELSNTRVNAEEAHKKIADFGTHAKETFAGVAKAAAAVVAAIIAVGTKVLEAGQDFDKSMSGVAATMGYSVDELKTEGSEANKTFEQLRATAQAYGKSTEKSATEASTALNNMAQAGYNAKTAIEMLSSVLDLSSAGELELADSSNYVTNSQKALGLTLEETKELIDQMAKASSKTNTKVGELGDGILKIGGTAKTLSGGTRELVENLGVLADNSITAAEGGTHLRNIILSLEKAMKDGAIEINGVKVAVTDADGEMREMSEVFLDVEAAMSGLTKTGKDTELLKIFNKTDLAAVNAFLGTTAERWDELKNEIEDSAGAAHAMAETKLDNLAGDITLFKSALEGAEITISDKLNPKLRETVQFGTEMVSRLADGFGQGGLAGAVEQAHKVIAEQLGEEAELVFGVEAAVEGAVSAWLTYKGVTLLTEGIEALQAMLGLTQANTAATEELNAAQAANPYALIAALAVGAATAIKKLIDIQTDLIDETSNAYDLLDEQQKTAVDNVKAIAENVEKSRKAYQDETEVIENQAETYRGLAEELYKLDSQQVINTEDRVAMRAITEKLSKSVKGLNIELDEQTGHLKTQRKSIDEIINSYEKQAKAAAAQQRLTDLYVQQMESQSAYKKSLEKVEKAEQKLVDLQEQKNEAARAYNIYLSERGNSWIASDADLDKEKQLLDRLNQTTQALENQKDKLGGLRASYSAAGETMRGVQEDIDSTKNTISESEEQFGVLVDVMQTGFDVIAKGSEEMAKEVVSSLDISEAVEETTTKIENIIKEYEDKLKSRTGTLQSWFEVNATVSGEDASFTALNTALNKQITSFEKWKNDIAQLEKEGINENFLDKLKDAGPKSQELVSALLSVSPEQRNAYAGTWDEAYQSAADVAKTQLEGMRKETETQISTMLSEIETLSPEFATTFAGLADSAVDGYIEKIKERLPELKEWGKAIGSETMEGEKEETDSHSPSRKWAELADNDIDGYVNEFKRRMSDAVSAARKMADDTMNAASRLFGGNIKTDIKGANAAAQAAATTQNAVQTTAAAPTINAADIAKAVSDSLQELVSGDFTEEITLDSDVLAAKTYKKIDILIGRDTTFRTRGYAK